MENPAAETPRPPPDGGVELEGIAVPGLERRLQKADLDVLIPLGALEQHGPHLPLGTDTIIARALGRAVAERVGALLVSPCLPVGCSDHHLSFAGTASIPEGLASEYLAAVARTLLSHGFRCAYLVSGHAGNIPSMRRAVATLDADERVAAFVDWPAQRTAMHEWAERELGLTSEQIGSHSGHFETSIMLHLTPELVDMDTAPEGFVGSVTEAAEKMSKEGMRAVSSVGVIGDPRGATAAAGEAYLEILIDSIAGFIEHHRMQTGG